MLVVNGFSYVPILQSIVQAGGGGGETWGLGGKQGEVFGLGGKVNGG